MTELARHLRSLARRPHVWGASDCCLAACDWVLARTGRDPAAGLRGRYRTACGAARHIARGGGFVALVTSSMRSAGLAETMSPVAGDVAIVEDVAGPTLAICVDTGTFAAKAQHGLVVAPYRHVVAWSVPCRSR